MRRLMKECPSCRKDVVEEADQCACGYNFTDPLPDRGEFACGPPSQGQYPWEKRAVCKIQPDYLSDKAHALHHLTIEKDFRL